MEIKMVSVAKLKPYINNPRKNDKAVAAVAESIKQFGFNVPITVDKNGEIATGHTRLKAAIKLGLTEVPVIELKDLTPEQIKAWRLVDNRTSEIAEWDYEALAKELQEIENIDLSLFAFEIPGTNESVHEDDFEVTLPVIPKSKYGDIYTLGKHRVMCGDATKQEDMDKLLDGKIADLVVTDPPYNVNYGEKGKLYNEKGGYECGMDDRTILNDNMDDQSFYVFLREAMAQIRDHLKPGGAFYIWHAETTSHLFRNAAIAEGLKYRQTLIWKKNAMVLGRQDWQWIHEPCLYGWRDGAGHYFINDRGYTTVLEEQKIDYNKLSKPDLIKMLRAIQEPSEATSVIEEAKPTRNDLHPTMKPIRLIGRLIANSSKPGEKVLDPFGGSGSTLIAAEQLQRVCYATELDPKYVDVIVERWETFTGKKAIKESN